MKKYAIRRATRIDFMYRSDGLTIVELLVAVVIVGILASIPAANMVAYKGFRGLPNAVDEIISDIQHARTTAVKLEESCTINFNTPAPDWYTITINNTPISKSVALNNFPGGVAFLGASPDAGEPAPVNSITFSPRGFATSAGAVYLASQQNPYIYRVRTSLVGTVDSKTWDGGWQ